MSLAGMKRRLTYYGGAAQQDRMIRDKLWSMLSATKYSYQAARFMKYPEYDKEVVGLFNPVVQNLDYDTKMISTPFTSGYKVGDVVRWQNTQTLWIIYTQNLTELAYFRGNTRRCDYMIQWVDGNRKLCETPMSVVGPSMPDKTRMINGMMAGSFNVPSGNLVCLVTDNDVNRGYFHQDQTFLIQGIGYRVTQLDYISMPGVLQINATEYPVNKIEDDVEEDITNAWNIRPIIPEYNSDYGIEGPIAIKPYQEAKFEALVKGGTWFILENREGGKQLPAKFVEYNITQKVVHVYWDAPYRGSFTILYELPDGTRYQRHVLVESLM